MDQGFRLGNYPAYKIVYSFDTDRQSYWAMQVGTVLNSTYVKMTYNAQKGEYAKYVQTIEKILNSVKFTEPSANNLFQNGTLVTYKDPNNNFNLRYPLLLEQS